MFQALAVPVKGRIHPLIDAAKVILPNHRQGGAVASASLLPRPPPHAPPHPPHAPRAPRPQPASPPPKDGVFHNFGDGADGGRLCVNCHRGSLWPMWCGRRKTQQTYWDNQLCEETITKMAIKSAGEHE